MDQRELIECYQGRARQDGARKPGLRTREVATFGKAPAPVKQSLGYCMFVIRTVSGIHVSSACCPGRLNDFTARPSSGVLWRTL